LGLVGFIMDCCVRNRRLVSAAASSLAHHDHHAWQYEILRILLLGMVDDVLIDSFEPPK
jgi:hypothetical protein